MPGHSKKLLTRCVDNPSQDPALDAEVIPDAIRHRQIPGLQLGGVGLECEQQCGPWRVDETRPAQRRTPGNRQGCAGAGNLLEQLQQAVETQAWVHLRGRFPMTERTPLGP